jgi:hypothetical protein
MPREGMGYEAPEIATGTSTPSGMAPITIRRASASDSTITSYLPGAATALIFSASFGTVCFLPKLHHTKFFILETN